jgi:hypothetical protein
MREDVVFVFLAWTPRDAVIDFAGHVPVTDKHQPDASLAPEP